MKMIIELRSVRAKRFVDGLPIYEINEGEYLTKPSSKLMLLHLAEGGFCEVIVKKIHEDLPPVIMDLVQLHRPI